MQRTRTSITPSIDALLRILPRLDIVRIQDTDIAGADDATMLAWTAAEGRILLTHDVQTVTHFAYERVRAGLPMPGVFEVDDDLAIGRAVDDLLLLIEASFEGEWDNQIKYVPLGNR